MRRRFSGRLRLLELKQGQSSTDEAGIACGSTRAAVQSSSVRRAFVAETGQSPAKAVERLRLKAARFMIEQGRHTVNPAVQETGFADRECRRRAFLGTFGVPADAPRRSVRRGGPATGN